MSANLAVVVRRSHLKSKTGCKSCKRRRVKCDEIHPTCQQCNKVGIPCVYVTQAQNASSKSPVVSWPTFIEQSCWHWKRTGEPPFPWLYLTKSPSWHSMSLKELRYLYQMGLVESMLRSSGTSDMCPPWGDIPFIFQLANTFDFVTYMLAAGSASRLATIGKSREAADDAARYERLAIAGIAGAMQSLGKDNADAVLGAALGCSYTMSNYKLLMMVADISSEVTSQMQTWSKNSMFRRPLSSKAQEGQWTALCHETALHQRSGFDIDIGSISDLLMQGAEALGKLAICFREDLHYAAMIRCLRDALKKTHGKLGSDISVSEQFRIILPFTSWFSKDASSCYIAVSNRDPRTLIFLLHIYAVVISLTLALPATDFSIFASFRVRAILEICQALNNMREVWSGGCNHFHPLQEIVAFPLDAVRLYQRLRIGKLDFLM